VQVGGNQLETGGFAGVFELATGLKRGENQMEITSNVTVDVTPPVDRSIAPVEIWIDDSGFAIR
jgi:hypothetical protein